MEYSVPPALIIVVYHKTREEAGTVYQTNEDGSTFYFICSQTMKNIPMILFIAGGGHARGPLSSPLRSSAWIREPVVACCVHYEKSAG